MIEPAALTKPAAFARRGKALWLLDALAVVFVVGLALTLAFGRTAPDDETLAAIKQRGTVRIGMDASYPPFESVEGDHYVGYDVDLASDITKRLGAKPEFANIGVDGLYDALAVKRVDVLISALPYIPEFTKAYSYSVTYFEAGQVLVVRRGEAAVREVADLANKRVGVELGSDGDTEARRLTATIVGLQVNSVYRSPSEALEAVTTGEVDAAIVDSVSALGYIKREGRLEIVGEPVTSQPYYVAVRADDSRLLEVINQTIAEARSNGELAQLADKWF
jgi:ABC-type amino acid transport substrate-binding protein